MNTLPSIDYAPHIRGRVYARPLGSWSTSYGRPKSDSDLVWHFEVYNRDSGAFIAADNGYRTRELAHEACLETLAAARVSWMRGFGDWRVLRADEIEDAA